MLSPLITQNCTRLFIVQIILEQEIVKSALLNQSKSSLIFQKIRRFISEIIVKFAVVVNYAELHAFVYRPSVSRIITIRGNLRQIFIPFDSISRREILHLALITASFLDTHTARELHEPGDNRFKPEKPT